MRKKLLVSIMSLMMISLTACGGSGKTDNSAPEGTAVQSNNDAQTEENSASDDNRSEVLIDTDEFRVEYRGIDTSYSSNMWSIKLYIENHSESEINARINNILVNGCFIRTTSGDNIKIPAGESMEDNSNLINIDNVQYYQVKNLDTLQFDLDLVETENWESVCSAKAEYTENLPIPAGENKSSEYNTILYEANNILIKTAGVYDKDSSFKQFDVYMENNGEETAGVTFPNMKINGKDVEYSNAFIFMPPHSKSASVPLYDYLIKKEDLSALGVENIEAVTFDIEVNYETVKRGVSIDGQGNILESGEEANKQDVPEEVPDVAENTVDDQNTSAQTSDQETAPADETYEDKDEEITDDAEAADSGIEGIILDEGAWKDWKSEGRLGLMTFMKATSAVGIKWDLLPNPDKVEKDCYLIEDGEAVEDIAMYYAVDNQEIYYVGVIAKDSDVFDSDRYRDYCARFLRACTGRYESEDAEEISFTMTEERAREIVDYAIDNNQRCIADGIRIRINESKGTYGFHIEK